MIRFVISVPLLVASGCAGPHQLSSSGAGAFEASLTSASGRSAVAWYDTRDGNAEIYARIVDQHGRGAGASYRLTSDGAESYEADIVSIGDDFAVAWYEQEASGERRARLGLWDGGFQPLWTANLSPEGVDGRIPVIAVFENRIFGAWIETDAGGESRVKAGWWDLSGRQSSQTLTLGPAGPTTWNLNAALDGEGVAYVVFDAKAGTRAEELFLARTDGVRASLVRLTTDDGFSSKYPDLALTSGRAALTWFDERDGNREVYLLVAPLSELQEGAGSRATRITHTPGESVGAYVAWNADHAGLAWSDDTAGQHEVYFQSFDSEGSALAGANRLTHNNSASLIPSIEPRAGGFMLAWNEVVPDPKGIHGHDTRSEIVVSVVRTP